MVLMILFCETWTDCVEYGKKIQHSHERRRSQEVIDRILGNDRKKKTEDDINLSKQYTFSSFAQFKAIMVSMGYEVYQKDGNVFVKHGGKVQKEIRFTEIESLFKSGYREKTEQKYYRTESDNCCAERKRSYRKSSPKREKRNTWGNMQ